MKFLILGLLMAVLLTGCASEGASTDTSSAVSESVSAESSTPPVESTTDESKPESWTEEITKGNTTTITEYRNGGKDYTATTETVDENGALTRKKIKEYKNSVLVSETITEYLSTGEAFYDYTTYYDESGEPERFVGMDRGQTYVVYCEGTRESDGSSQATVRYESLDGVLLAEGTERSYDSADVWNIETQISVYDETGACDHQEKHTYSLGCSLWEYFDADGNLIYAHCKMGDTEEITRTGENGGIVRAQGRKYSFADLNGTEFAKSTMENGCFYIFFTTSTEDEGQRARALWEYVTSFDKTFFLQTIHSS